MSLVPLERVTFAGLSGDKPRLLDDLHQRGWLELIPLADARQEAPEGGSSSPAREALKFLLACPQRRRQVSDDSSIDAAEVERRALELQQRMQTLEAERDDLLERLDLARPWGDFRFCPLNELGDLRLWFYVVPHRELPKVAAPGRVWQVVRRDPRFAYVVVVSAEEPTAMPGARSRLGARSPADMARRLEQVELALEDAQAERAYLTRWCLLLARDLTRLEDAAARAGAARLTYDRDPLFALQAWVPREHVAELTHDAAQQRFVFDSRPPAPGENPPTLVRNAPQLQAGEDLVNFYMTPGYWTWDPSSVVFVSFAVFFAMIMADAGYAAVLGLGLLFLWRRLRRRPRSCRCGRAWC